MQTKLNTEKEEKIQFLDLTINRKKQNMFIDIYRKPTETDTTINCHSKHTLQQKLSAYRYHINRLNTLPINTEEKKNEEDKLESVAINNSYPMNTVKKLKEKLKRIRTGTQERKKKWTPFTYFSPMIRKVTNIFKVTDIKIAYRATNTLFKQLTK